MVYVHLLKFVVFFLFHSISNYMYVYNEHVQQ